MDKKGKEMMKRVCVYTRPVDPDRYPDGLARSIHIAFMDGEQKHPFNRNYGILFAKGLITDQNTICPMGVQNPRIFVRQDGSIGLSAERVCENGDPDETSAGRVLLWKTTDLIRFDEMGLIPADEVPSDASAQLDVEDALLQEAIAYWDPIRYTGVTLPDPIEVRSEEELDHIKAQLHYSDGSVRSKRIRWDASGIDFQKPGSYHIKGSISGQSFSFPLAKGYGDPVIFPWEGKWYYISTNDNLDDIGLYVREADRVDGLFREGIAEHLILPFDKARGFEQTFWAPEFHVIGDDLYLLFAVSGHIWGPQCHMMRKKKDAPITDADSWEDPVRVIRKDGSPLATDGITLDMTCIRAESGSYVIWSYRENIGLPLDTGSMLYIAPIDEREPWKLASDPVLLTRPLYGWENVSGTINNEGPYALIRNGKVFVTYSGGSANAYTYALGLLTADSTADLCDLSSWTKSLTPVLTFYSVKGEYGPGHNSFYVNEEGEVMIAYHAETGIHEHLRCDGIRRVHFRKNQEPYFQMSANEDIDREEVHAAIRCV